MKYSKANCYRCFLSPLLLAVAITFVTTAQAQSTLEKANAFVKKAIGHQTEWNGPTSGPKAESGKFIVFVSADQTNSGIRTVADGVAQAAKVIGWKYRVLNGRGSVSGRAGALSQAIALNPDGIILGGFNAQEDASDVRSAVERGIKIVGWHAASTPGSIKNPKIFTNITTPAKQTGVAAAYLAIAKSDGKANAVIFTDSAFSIALAKSNVMAETLKQCKGCKVLKVRDAALSSAMSNMPQIASSYLQKYGSKWTYTLGINDLYFDGMAPALSAAGMPEKGPPYNISAGDGSQSAFQRIRQNRYQYATIPEPLYEQAWQAVDELNRAFAGKSPSNFIAPIHIVTPKDISYIKASDGIYDPDNNYRQHYRVIWGKHK